jgi:long-subunit acyl-CoA synthetase (AMP-forming)
VDTSTATRAGPALAGGSLIAHFRRQVSEQPDAPALYRHAGGRWQATTWAQFGEQARCLARLPGGRGRPRDVETVKRGTVLPSEVTVGEELTPTFTVRRALVAERYAAEIEAMYPAPRHSEAA